MMAQNLPTRKSMEQSIVVLFGPQGSTDIFEQRFVDRALRDVHESTLASRFLSRCHAAFCADLSSVRHRLQDDDLGLTSPSEPKDLLSFPTVASTHPLVEATRLCLFQLLRFMRAIHNPDEVQSWSSTLSTIVECAGFSSGIIPATAIAAASDFEDLIEYSVAAFRVAFWIGYRNWCWCRKIGIHFSTKDACSLALKCVDSTPESIIEELQSAQISFSLAGISDDDWITLAGTPAELGKIRKKCAEQRRFTTAWLHIHGLYHTGDLLRDLISEICEDVRYNKIGFPDFEHLKRPLRSSYGGSYLASGTSLVESVLTTLLSEPFDWSSTSISIAATLDLEIEKQLSANVCLLCIGPSSGVSSSGIRRRITRSLSGFTIEDAWTNATPQTATILSPESDDIAIVGMAVDMPGAANLDELWDLLSQSKSTVEEIPSTRFDVSQYKSMYDDESRNTRKMSTKYGNFLGDIFSLDQGFFKISSREAKSMDPQQKVLLRVTKEALENAGYVADSTPSCQRETIGCYIGVATGDYTDNLADDIDVYYTPGTLRAFLSGKLSFQYKWSGPSLVVDTACSSSAVAIYQACRALKNKDCTVAIAGGVNTISSPDMYLGLDRGHFLSPTGQCKPFDIKANGYCRAEGCGVFVLKPLRAALADNDRIHGVIRSIEVNQSGCSHSITHPSSDAQASLLRRLLTRANVAPATVQVVEAHGTGTQAGDKTELKTLQDVFSKVKRHDKVLVTSIKGNIGHCEAASGAAGLAKLLMMLQHDWIPPQASLDTLNPSLSDYLGESITIPREATAWRRDANTPRRAILNNFGAAGSNAALLLEEYVPPRSNATELPTRSAYPLIVSAKSSRALVELSDHYREHFIADSDGLRLLDSCYTATARREKFDHTTALVVTSREQAIMQLSDQKHESTKQRKPLEVVFVFSGQGSAYRGMAKELVLTSPLFRRVTQECDGILKNLGVSGVIDFFAGQGEASASIDDPDNIILTQCACVVLQYSLSKLWMSWSVHPSVVIGHSLGEYAALAISGVLSINDCLRLTVARARLMIQHCATSSSGMLACRLPPQEVQSMLHSASELAELEIACRNSPKDCVLAGPLMQLRAFSDRFNSTEAKMSKLEVPYAFHSSAMDGILSSLHELASSVAFSKPSIPVYSTALGRQARLSDFNPDYLVSHTRRPVLLTDAVEALHNDLAQACFVEIGPHPATLPMIAKSWQGDTDTMMLPSLRRSTASWTTLSQSICQLSATQKGLHWRNFFDGTGARLTDLPGHPLFAETSGISYAEHEARSEALHEQLRQSHHAFGLRAIASGTQATCVYTTSLQHLGKFIEGHKVGGTAICPASVYYELVLEAVHLKQEHDHDTVWTVRDVQFAEALTYRGDIDDTRLVEVELEAQSSGAFTFMVSRAEHESSPRRLCCSGSVRLQSTSRIRTAWLRQEALAKRQREQFSESRSSVSFNYIHRAMLYDTVFARVVAYSSEYQAIQGLAISLNGREGYGSVLFGQQSDGFIVPPIVSDTLLHSCGFIANSHANLGDVYICGKLGTLTVLYNDLDTKSEYSIYCTLLQTSQDILLADALLLDHNDAVVAAAEGIEFKKVRLSSFQAFLSRAGNQVTMSHDSTRAHSKKSDSSIATPVRSSASSDGQSIVSHTIMQLVADTCGVSRTNLDTQRSLDSLGIDSMMLIELRAGLEKLFPSGKFRTQDLGSDATIATLVESVQLSDESGLTTPAPHASEKIDVDLPNGDVESAVTILAGLCGADAKAITTQTTLDSLGVDSMMLLELQELLAKQQQRQVSIEQLTSCRIVADLEGLINESPAHQDDTTTNRQMTEPVLLHSGAKDSIPVYLIHDGSGSCSMYRNLGDVGRALWGFSDLHDDRPAASLEALARRYATSIEARGERRVLLGGWSFGGVVAFEAARQLAANGCQVEGVILIDSPFPTGHQALPEPIIDYVTAKVSSSSKGKSEAARSLVSAKFGQHAAMLERYQPVESSTTFAMAFLRSRDVMDTESLCGVDYPWLSDEGCHESDAHKWRQFSSKANMEQFDIPGTHFEPFDQENVYETAQCFRRAIESLCKH